MIEITGADLVVLAKKAYELSSPKGMGFMQYTPKPLTDEVAKSLINEDDQFPLSMDYVYGRSIKLHVHKKDGKMFLQDSWYDHTDSQYKELLSSVGIEISPSEEHNPCCECVVCGQKRRG